MTDKALSLCVLHVLREYSDDRHPMTANAVIDKLKELYELEPDRRSVYSAVDTLRELGYEISDRADNGKGYYLKARVLEISQVQMLIDAVASFPFLSERQTKGLILGIRNMLSLHQQEELQNVTIRKPEGRSLCRTVLGTLETLDDAINQKKKVSFYYLQCGPDLKPRRRKNREGKDRLYTVNPYGMIYLNEHYYLACVYEGIEKASLYRLDRIESVKILDKPVDHKLTKKQMKEMVDNATYAQMGEAVHVVLECEEQYISDVVDRFGEKIHVDVLEDGRVRISLKSNRQGVVYWALQYLKHVEIKEPADLREEIVQLLQNNSYLAAPAPTIQS